MRVISVSDLGKSAVGRLGPKDRLISRSSITKDLTLYGAIDIGKMIACACSDHRFDRHRQSLPSTYGGGLTAAVCGLFTPGCSWYKAPTLSEAIDQAAALYKSLHIPFILQPSGNDFPALLNILLYMRQRASQLFSLDVLDKHAAKLTGFDFDILLDLDMSASCLDELAADFAQKDMTLYIEEHDGPPMPDIIVRNWSGSQILNRQALLDIDLHVVEFDYAALTGLASVIVQGDLRSQHFFTSAAIAFNMAAIFLRFQPEMPLADTE